METGQQTNIKARQVHSEPEDRRHPCVRGEGTSVVVDTGNRHVRVRLGVSG